MAPEQPWPEGEVDLAPGETLVLYTDGLVERRGESLDDGFARLVGTAAALARREPEALADELLIGMLSEDGDDDVAIVVYRQP